MESEKKEIFFFTIDYPHRWSSGPILITIEDDYSPIKSLDRARELAEEHKVGGADEDTVRTTYGSFYGTERER